MEIRDARSPLLAVPFSNLKPGETFTSGANLFLRTQAKTSEVTAIVNAVVLGDGRMACFAGDDEVIPVRAYIVKEA